MSANFDQAKTEAQRVLEEHSIKSPPIPIVEIANNYGLNVRKINFNKYSGTVAGLINLKDSTIYVNEDDSEERQAFTVAHELGHYLLHKEKLEEDPKLSILFRKPLGQTDPNPLEQEANTFAAEILVPMVILREYLNKGIKEPVILADIFGVSQEVISYRIKDEKKER